MTDSHKSTAPVRHWFRFSLRTLFVIVTVAAIASPGLVEAYREWHRRLQAQTAPQITLPTRLDKIRRLKARIERTEKRIENRGTKSDLELPTR